MICSSLNRFFTSNLPYPGLDSKSYRYSKPGGRRIRLRPKVTRAAQEFGGHHDVLNLPLSFDRARADKSAKDALFLGAFARCGCRFDYGFGHMFGQ